MTDKKLTDKEIKKALECCSVGTFACDEECPCFHSKSNLKVSSCRFELIGEVLDYINRLEAVNERLQEENARVHKIIPKMIKTAKAEAYKEFYKKLHAEILEAKDSNFKAKKERVAKSKKLGIPIDVEDSFLMYCDGKIRALDGIDYFAYETVKEMESEGT